MDERDMSSPEPDFGAAETSSPMPSSAHPPLTVPPLIITLTGPAPKITKKHNLMNRLDTSVVILTQFGSGTL